MTPEREKLLWRLLYAAGAGFFLLGVFTVWLGPNSAASLETRLQKAADSALTSANLTSWTARAQGASVRLEGVAASEDERREVVQMLKAATGNGDVRWGDVVIATRADPFEWTARKENGFVTIEGVAPSRQALIAIHDAAKRLYPSKATDLTTLASGAPEGVDWGAAAVVGLEALKKLESGAVRLSGKELLVTGFAASETEAQIASNWVLRVGGGVKPKVDILGPPEFVATARDWKIVLQGKAASESARRDLKRAATLSRTAVDETYVSSVGPWQARTLKALPALAEFEHGEIVIRGRVFRISGKAPGSVLGYLREDMAAIEDGYRVEYDVSEAEADLSSFPGINLPQAGVARGDICQTAFDRIAGVSRIVFGRNSAEIERVSGPSLDRLVTVARACADLDIEIQGHTDSRGRRPANLALSQARARAVKDYLVGRGLSADGLSAVGFGPDRPIASNRTESGRAKNRRIDFRVIRGEGP